MARGGSIYRRRLASGEAAWVIMYRVGGRQVKRTIRGSRRDAEAALTAALAERDRGGRRTVSIETFASYAEHWLEVKRPRLELSTYLDYERHLRLRLVPALGSLKLRQITRHRIERYLAALDEEGRLSRKSINDSLIPLRQVLNRAVREGIIASNPAASTDRDEPLELPYEQPEGIILDAAALRRYLEAAPPAYRPLAELLVATGLRLGEALALEWSDVDLDAQTLLVRRTVKRGGIGGTKSDRPRTVVIDSQLARTLREHRRATRRLAGLVYPSENGTHLNPSNVRNRWHRVTVADAGLDPRTRLHDLRHAYATLLGASGESILFIQRQLGHAALRTTQRYVHPDLRAHREAAERAARYWRGA